MKAKNTRAAALVLLAFCFLLAACSPAANTNPGGASDTPGTGASEVDVTFPLKETLNVTWMRRETSQQKMELDAPLIQYIKEKLNVDVHLQTVPEADYATKRASVFASNSLPDVLDDCTPTEVMKYGPSGMLLSIDKYKEYAKNFIGLVTADDRVTESNKLRVNGELYGFYKLEYDRIALAPINLIRVDLLEEQNIPMPTTWDEFYNALLKIKEKHPDMYGFSARNGTNYLLGQYAFAMGSGGYPTFYKTRGIYFEPDTNSYVYGPTSENFVRVVEFMAKAYKDGLLDPDYATMNKDMMFERLSTGKLMSVCDNNSFAARVYNPALKEIDADAYFDLVPPLADQDGNVRSLRYERDWAEGSAVVSSKVKEPERIVSFIDWLYSEEAILPTNFGREGIDFDMVEGVPTIKQEIVDRNASAPDPFMAIQGELGVGYHGFARYIDEKTHLQVSDPIFIEQSEKITGYTESGDMQYLPGWPPLTGEDASRVTELEMKLGNVFDQEIDKFITGKASLETDWPKLVATLKSQGAEELEEIFNRTYQESQK